MSGRLDSFSIPRSRKSKSTAVWSRTRPSCLLAALRIAMSTYRAARPGSALPSRSNANTRQRLDQIDWPIPHLLDSSSFTQIDPAELVGTSTVSLRIREGWSSFCFAPEQAKAPPVLNRFSFSQRTRSRNNGVNHSLHRENRISSNRPRRQTSKQTLFLPCHTGCLQKTTKPFHS